MATPPTARLTPEQYLEIERKAEYKSEYFNDEMFAMSGAREGHNMLASNLITSLNSQTRGRPCRVYPSDMRVIVSANGLYAYPDVVVVCGPPQFFDDTQDSVLNPIALVEVLSPSTEAYDHSLKFEQYRSIESLRHYLMVSSDRMHLELFTRQQKDQWLLTSVATPEDRLALESIECTLLVSDVYDKVDFPPGVPVYARPEIR